MGSSLSRFRVMSITSRYFGNGSNPDIKISKMVKNIIVTFIRAVLFLMEGWNHTKALYFLEMVVVQTKQFLIRWLMALVLHLLELACVLLRVETKQKLNVSWSLKCKFCQEILVRIKEEAFYFLCDHKQNSGCIFIFFL